MSTTFCGQLISSHPLPFTLLFLILSFNAQSITLQMVGFGLFRVRLKTLSTFQQNTNMVAGRACIGTELRKLAIEGRGRKKGCGRLRGAFL
jgi:hypothetical protein